MNRFAKPAQSWTEIFDLIQQSEIGKETLEKFLKLQRTVKLSVTAFPPDLRSQLAAAQLPGYPLGAAFITDGQAGQIYYDGQGELGTLVPFFFHEMIHSLDDSLWLLPKKMPGEEEKARVIYLSECRAYAAQYQLLEHLKKSHTELKRFYRSQYPQIEFFERELSPNEIAISYRFQGLK